jgi:hypothetical protein
VSMYLCLLDCFCEFCVHVFDFGAYIFNQSSSSFYLVNLQAIAVGVVFNSFDTVDEIT